MLLLLGSLFTAGAVAQEHPKVKLHSRYGEVHVCLLEKQSRYCWINREANMVFNPINGDFAIEVPSEMFRFERATYDSIPTKATVALRHSPSFLFAGTAAIESEFHVDQPGEYAMRLDGKVTYGDAVFPASCEGVLVVTNAAREFSAEVIFDPKDFNIDFFRNYGMRGDRVALELFMQMQVEN